MNKDELINQYFDWICSLVLPKRPNYYKLLSFLHNTEFTYKLALDENRFVDGIDLRYRFGYDNRISDIDISNYLDTKPASVLEMMAALSLKCEENIMSDDDVGDRTAEWFWVMIKSLGLENMDDDRFDRKIVDDVVYTFLSRKYERDGTGGLFRIPNCKKDLRRVEIWYQMCWYLDTIL